MNNYSLPYGFPRAGGAGVIPEKGNYRPAYGDRPLEPMPPAHEAEGYTFKPQVMIMDGQMCDDADHTAAVTGQIDEKAAKNVTMTCDAFNINGFVVGGSSRYTISDSTFDFKGDGIDDFNGWGAEVQAMDASKVVIENSRLTTTGVIRPCTSCVNTATMIIKNCELIGNGGTITEETKPAVNGGMLTPPPGLGIGGNCRTHLSTGNSHTYFYDSRIVANGWAAMSCDSGYGDLYIEANRCEIVNKDIGYATFSDGGCYVVINDSKVEAATHAMIMGGRSRQRVHNSTVVSDGLALMSFTILGHHSEIAELTIDHSTIEAADDVILAKSHNMYIDLRDVTFNAKNGVLIHSVRNDDFMATRVYPGEVPYGIKVIMCDMDAVGDVLHEDPQRTMALAINHATLTGGIMNAAIALDEAAKWTADKDSKVMIYGSLGEIDALPGVTITACCDCMEPQTITLPSGGTLVIEDMIEPLPMPPMVGFDEKIFADMPMRPEEAFQA